MDYKEEIIRGRDLRNFAVVFLQNVKKKTSNPNLICLASNIRDLIHNGEISEAGRLLIKFNFEIADDEDSSLKEDAYELISVLAS
jgi:hypothetical protein